ncbi:MAG: cardiolipin synthase [Phycisphaerales bacterium JB063]
MFGYEMASWMVALLVILDWVIRITLSLRVIMRRRPVGVSLSWLGVILVLPVAGAVLYLLLGETRIGRMRRRRFERIRDSLMSHLSELREHGRAEESALPRIARATARHGEAVYGFPALDGNEIELLEDSDAVFNRLIQDIDAAQETVHMFFYIWWEGGRVDEVIAALRRARERGVVCRLALDAQGCKQFLSSASVGALKEQGVEVVCVLPMSVWRMLFRRQDLRNHRKIVVIDGEVGYTGSMNMADPAVFKQEVGVGRWIDAMVRITGPAVEALGLLFLTDWDVETAEEFGDFQEDGGLHRVDPKGDVAIQVLPSGPGYFPHAIRETLLTAIYSAQHELILTTPYFVPDEALLAALTSAARRGVDVTLIVPGQVDSVMVRLASRSQYVDLLSAGVHVAQFQGGLLHTKSLTVDGRFALIGTVNLDMRSMWLNFEITVAIYDESLTQSMVAMQRRYMEQSRHLDAKTWANRPFHWRVVENIARLLGPLL